MSSQTRTHRVKKQKWRYDPRVIRVPPHYPATPYVEVNKNAATGEVTSIDAEVDLASLGTKVGGWRCKLDPGFESTSGFKL